MPVLVLDAGNALFKSRDSGEAPDAKARAELLLSQMDAQGTAAMAVGTRDRQRACPVAERGDRRVGGEDEPATVCLEPVLLDEAMQDGVVLVAVQESRRADDLLLAVDGIRDPEATLGRRRVERLVPPWAGRVRRRRELLEELRTLARRGRVESLEPAL